jgi:hypothetical protein
LSESSRSAGQVVWDALGRGWKEKGGCRRKPGNALKAGSASLARCQSGARRQRLNAIPWPFSTWRTGTGSQARLVSPHWQREGLVPREAARRSMTASDSTAPTSCIPVPGLWMGSARRAGGRMHHNQRHETPFPHLACGTRATVAAARARLWFACPDQTLHTRLRCLPPRASLRHPSRQRSSSLPASSRGARDSRRAGVTSKSILVRQLQP